MKNKGKRIIEKTPMHIKWIKRIFRVCPNAQIIHIKREPKAVIASMLNSHFYKFAENLEDAVDKYNSLFDQFHKFKNDSRIYELSY